MTTTMIMMKKKEMNTKCVSLLLLLALLVAVTTNHVAEAVFTAPLASPSRDAGEGWYFREFSIRVGSNPGPGMYVCVYVCVRALVYASVACDTTCFRAFVPFRLRMKCYVLTDCVCV